MKNSDQLFFLGKLTDSMYSTLGKFFSAITYLMVRTDITYETAMLYMP